MPISITPKSRSQDTKSILTLLNLDEKQFHQLFADSAKKINADFDNLSSEEIAEFKTAAYELQQSGQIPALLDDAGNFLIPLEELIASWHLPK